MQVSETQHREQLLAIAEALRAELAREDFEGSTVRELTLKMLALQDDDDA